ncbi:class I SAM-dependent methyltransferase [Paenibacillus sp.]|uniref:class I SAM-dependent methyltransferase n=1 Tax=Paenibacillus sp. TaxID=58172 RepID=UPI002D26633B|nr:class I SAM-dependent methyltransferase [Paenibacillus sp.]HZG86736.1 class I SAM-dependent methyltransferase [Paenibacillus sp.]
MASHDEVYAAQAELYDAMIRRQPDVSVKIRDIRPYRGLDVLDLGAGTGRLSVPLAMEAKSLVCTDASRSMLDVLERRLTESGAPNVWTTVEADHRRLPLPDHSFDLAVSGWSVCYLASSSRAEWKSDLERVHAELCRVVRPGGTIMLFETMGTGTATPNPPNFLTDYYGELVQTYGFAHDWFRADYRFDSVEEAKRLTEFFFGSELAAAIEANGWSTVPECAGVWWKTAS